MKFQTPWAIADADSLGCKVAKIFLRAANEIKKQGWCQGEARNSTGQICLVSSVITALHDADYFGGEVFEAAFSALGDAVGKQPGAWNDAPGRTQEDVIGLLQRTAVLAYCDMKD